MSNGKKFMDYAEEIMDVFRRDGIEIDPVPDINLIENDADRLDPFVPTGNYDYSTGTINLYISQRHAKDILRSFAHELVHHSQYLRNPDEYEQFDKSGKIADNDVLREYEAEAYQKGNILFRNWTESVTG